MDLGHRGGECQFTRTVLRHAGDLLCKREHAPFRTAVSSFDSSAPPTTPLKHSHGLAHMCHGINPHTRSLSRAVVHIYIPHTYTANTYTYTHTHKHSCRITLHSCIYTQTHRHSHAHTNTCSRALSMHIEIHSGTEIGTYYPCFTCTHPHCHPA